MGVIFVIPQRYGCVLTIMSMEKNFDFFDSKNCGWLCRGYHAIRLRQVSQPTTPLSDVPYANSAQGHTPETNSSARATNT